MVRAVAKGLATHQLKKKVDTGGFQGWLKKAAVDVGNDVTKNADLRCARLLPGKIFATDFVVAPGTYDLTAEFLGPDGHIIKTEEIPAITVKSGDFNLVRVMSAE